jgi:hypothetical protein
VVFVLGNSGNADRFPFLPESLRPVAKKVTGATTLCVWQCDVTRRPSEGLQPGVLFRCERGDDFFEARITARLSLLKRQGFFQSARRYEVDPIAGADAARNTSTLAL